mgnify:CR=1 FL=1
MSMYIAPAASWGNTPDRLRPLYPPRIMRYRFWSVDELSRNKVSNFYFIKHRISFSFISRDSPSYFNKIAFICFKSCFNLSVFLCCASCSTATGFSPVNSSPFDSVPESRVSTATFGKKSLFWVFPLLNPFGYSVIYTDFLAICFVHPPLYHQMKSAMNLPPP